MKRARIRGGSLTPFFSPNINEVCIWRTWRVCIQVELVTGGLSPVCASCFTTSRLPLSTLRAIPSHPESCSTNSRATSTPEPPQTTPAHPQTHPPVTPLPLHGAAATLPPSARGEDRRQGENEEGDRRKTEER